MSSRAFDDNCRREPMAAQQTQVKLFTYSVVERKDEIEEVSVAAGPGGPPVDDDNRCTRAHHRTRNAAPCVYVYVVCRPSRSLSWCRVFILFYPLEIRTVLPNAPEHHRRSQRSRVPRCTHQSHQQGQESGGSHQPGTADRSAPRVQEPR